MIYLHDRNGFIGALRDRARSHRARQKTPSSSRAPSTTTRVQSREMEGEDKVNIDGILLMAGLGYTMEQIPDPRSNVDVSGVFLLVVDCRLVIHGSTVLLLSLRRHVGVQSTVSFRPVGRCAREEEKSGNSGNCQ